MKRLSDEQIGLIRKLSKKGLSLRGIQKITKIPLSTIQYRLNKNKKAKREKSIKIPSSNYTKGEITGAFAGDGSYYHDKNKRSGRHIIRYHLSYKDDLRYANYLVSIFKRIGLNLSIYTRKYKGELSSLEIRFLSINFLRFVKSYLHWEGQKRYSVGLKKDVRLYNNDFLRGFARGLMDTDGFTEISGVACGVVSKKLIKNLRDILNKFGISSKLTIKQRSDRRDLYLLRVRKKDLMAYQKYIGFSNPRKRQRLLQLIKK